MAAAEEFRTHQTLPWRTPTRYDTLVLHAQGRFGPIASTTDTSSGIKCVMTNFSQASFAQNDNARCVFREIRILRILTDDLLSDDVVELYDMFAPEATLDNFQEFYVATDFMPLCLQRLILSEQILQADHIRYIMLQIIQALKFMHSANIVHMNLMPSCIGIDDACNIKIQNFHAARFAGTQWTEDYSHSRRSYVAPESMLRWAPICLPMLDLWSAGCIMAELFNRTTLFPGPDTIQTLHLIVTMRGFPMDEFLTDMPEVALRHLEQYRGSVAQPMEAVLPTGCAKARDCVNQLLSYHNRPTAAQLLQHPYFEQFADPQFEPVHPGPIDSSFDVERPAAEWQAMIFAEITDFKRHRASQPPEVLRARKERIQSQQHEAALIRQRNV